MSTQNTKLISGNKFNLILRKLNLDVFSMVNYFYALSLQNSFNKILHKLY